MRSSGFVCRLPLDLLHKCKSSPHPPASRALRSTSKFGRSGADFKVPLPLWAGVCTHLDFAESQCRGTSPRSPALGGLTPPKPPASEFWGITPRSVQLLYVQSVEL